MADLQSEIWRMQIQSDIAGLVDLLKHESPVARTRSALALRAMGASAAIPTLQMALMDERDPATRKTLVAVLDDLFQLALEDGADLPPQQHHPIVSLIDQLSGQSHEQIMRAAQQLGERGAKIAAETLVRVFENKDLPSRVRLTAAEALVKLDCAPVEVSLLAGLRHAEARVRRSAVGVLGQLGASWAVDALIPSLDDENELVRKTATAALRYIATPEALAAVNAPRLTVPPPPEPPVPAPVSAATPLLPAAPPAPLLLTPAHREPPIEEEDTRPALPTADEEN